MGGGTIGMAEALSCSAVWCNALRGLHPANYKLNRQRQPAMSPCGKFV